MRRKRPDVLASRLGTLTAKAATGNVALVTERTGVPAHFACVAVGLVLLFCSIEYGQSGTVFVCGLWQQLPEGGQTNTGHSAITLSRTSIIADVAAAFMTYANLV